MHFYEHKHFVSFQYKQMGKMHCKSCVFTHKRNSVNRALAGTLFHTIVLLPAISPDSLSALFCLLYHYPDAMQSYACLLTPKP